MVWIPWFDTAAGVGVLRKSTISPLYRNNNISNLFTWFYTNIKPFYLVLGYFSTVLYTGLEGLGIQGLRGLEV